MRASPVVLAVLLLTVACRGPEEGDDVALSEAVADDLAVDAEEVARAIEDDDACRALAAAADLRDRAESALVDGSAPATVVTESVRVITEVTAELSCEPADEDAVDEDVSDEDVSDTDPSDDAAGPDDGGPGGSEDPPQRSPGRGDGPPPGADRGQGQGRGP